MVKKKSNPKKVENAFLKETKGLIKKEEVEVKELKEFVLLLMKNNGYIDIIEDVQPGEFIIKTKAGVDKSILLTPNKIHGINYNKQSFKGWVAHEDNMCPYPQEPLHNGEMYVKVIQKTAMNYRDANDHKVMETKAKVVLWFIGVGLLALYILYIMGKKSGWFANSDGITETKIAAESIKTIVNTTGVRVS